MSDDKERGGGGGGWIKFCCVFLVSCVLLLYFILLCEYGMLCITKKYTELIHQLLFSDYLRLFTTYCMDND
jgi:hypothetical protein